VTSTITGVIEAQDAILGRPHSGWTPMGRPGTRADAGAAIVALWAHDAGWITGQTIVVDGGAALHDHFAGTDIEGYRAGPGAGPREGTRAGIGFGQLR
jgi:hypothetical protein